MVLWSNWFLTSFITVFIDCPFIFLFGQRCVFRSWSPKFKPVILLKRPYITYAFGIRPIRQAIVGYDFYYKVCNYLVLAKLRAKKDPIGG